MLARIIDTNNDTVIRAYEDKLAKLEREKVKQSENLANQTPPAGAFDKKLELALRFLANPWKLWETGHVQARRLVLKLAFGGPIAYCRIEGARTPKISIPFTALGCISGGEFIYGAGGGTRTHTGIRPSDFKSDMSTIPSRPHLALSSDFQIQGSIGPESCLLVTTPCFVYVLPHQSKGFIPAASKIPQRVNPGHRVLLSLCNKTRRSEPPRGVNQVHS